MNHTVYAWSFNKEAVILFLTTGLCLKRPQMNLKQQGVYATVFKQ